MPAIDYAYDPTGTNPANRIELEVFDVVDRGIIPLHGPFFKEGFIVEARLGNNPWEEIYELEHYNFSPVFMRVSAATGKRVYSYIFLNVQDLSVFTQVRISYTAVGQYEDAAVMAKVIEMTPSERFHVYRWRKIHNVATYPLDSRDPSLENKDIMEVVAGGLLQIRQALDKLNRAGATNFDVVVADLEEKHAEFESRLNQIVNGNNDPADADVEAGAVVFATFVGLIGTSDSDTFRPHEITMYRYIDIWTTEGTSFAEDIQIQVYRDNALIDTFALPAGSDKSRLEFAVPFQASFDNSIRIRANNPTAVAGNIHARIYQRQV